MDNSKIFKKTLPFVWARLLAMIVLTVVFIVYIVIASLFISFVNADGFVGLLIVILLIGGGFSLYRFLKNYIDFMIRAGHISVIAEMATNKAVPNEGIFKYGTERVKQRFVTTNVFFLLDKLVAGSVKQIQRMVNKIGEWLSKIPGMNLIVTIINMFIGVVLGYVDEAILARIFIREEESAWKGAADGIVLYFQNWKEILKNAAKIVIGLIIFYAVGMIILFGISSSITNALIGNTGFLKEVSTLVSLLVSVLILNILKYAFVDTYITISVINKFFKASNNQTPAFDFYGKAQKWSSKFKKIVTNAEADGASFNEQPHPMSNTTMQTNSQTSNQTELQTTIPQTPTQNEGVAMNNVESIPNQQQVNQPVAQNPNIIDASQVNSPKVCANCGSATESAFCTNCGNKVE